MRNRLGSSLVLLAMVITVCVTAKLTSDVVKSELAIPVNSQEVTRIKDGVEETKDPISEYRKEREQLRAMQKSQLNDIIHDPSSEASIIKSAQEHLMKIMSSEKTETDLEGMIRMRGFEDCVVVAGDDNLNALIRCDTLTAAETTLILEMITSETGFSAGNVKIIPIN
ncbi:MAG: SpoIIIAH-like family protein [Clostridiales bacterium]|nr:SpoIIIAH-like family protein [Clostridiales bacterium]